MMRWAPRRLYAARTLERFSRIWAKTFKDRSEAQQVAEHYIEVLERIREKGLQS